MDIKKINKTSIFIMIIIFLIILIDFSLKKVVYTKDADRGMFYLYAKIRNLPAITVNDKKISYVNFKNIANKDFFFQLNINKDKIFSNEDIKNDIENKIIKDLFLESFSKQNNIFVDDREIYNETKKYIEEFGSKENLEMFLKNTYDITLDFFQENYIKSYVLKDKIDTFIRTSDRINKDSLRKMKEAESKLKNNDFLKIAKEYNQEEKLKESSGIFGWISKEDITTDFPGLQNYEFIENAVTPILNNRNGYYIFKIMDIDKSDIRDEKVKIAMIKLKTMDLNQYLQKENNNIRIREYIK